MQYIKFVFCRITIILFSVFPINSVFSSQHVNFITRKWTRLVNHIWARFDYSQWKLKTSIQAFVVLIENDVFLACWFCVTRVSWISLEQIIFVSERVQIIFVVKRKSIYERLLRLSNMSNNVYLHSFEN